MIRKIRALGLVLMLLANVLLAIPFLQYAISETPTEADAQEVLLVSTTNSFPSANYVQTFSSIGLASDIVYVDEANETDIQSRIRSEIVNSSAQTVVLVAYDQACLPALRASLEQEKVSGVVLISPPLTGQEVITDFGISHPTIPVAIFDTKNTGSTGLYERLSGEDATLFEGLQDSNSTLSEVYISPDATRYLSQWNLLGNTKLSRKVLPYILQVQNKVAEFIQTYVQDKKDTSVDLRSTVFFTFAAQCMGFAMLIGGLFLFYSTIPAKRKEREKDTANSSTTLHEPQEMFLSQKHARANARAKLAQMILSVLFLLVGIVLYFLHFSLLHNFLLLWPVVYFLASLPFIFSYSVKAKLFTKIYLPRAVFSCATAVFMLCGLIMIKALVTFSISVTLFQDGYAKLAILSALFLSALIYMRNEEICVDQLRRRSNTHPLQFDMVTRSLALYLPAAGYMSVSIIDKNPVNISLAFIYILSLLAASLMKRFFKEISGSAWLSSLVFAIVYTLLVM